MKKVDELLQDVESKSLYKYQEPFVNRDQPFTDLDYKIVNDLFIRLKAIFPAFRHAWPSDKEFENAKREWMKAFRQVGLNDIESIKRGVDAFRVLETPFVPSPGQFIAMCKKEISLVPDFYIAIESQPASKEVREREMTKIMEMLGKS